MNIRHLLYDTYTLTYKSKKYILIYICLLILASFSMTNVSPYFFSIKKILFLILMILIGSGFILLVSSKKIELHVGVFFLLLIVGILFSCLTPINDVHDEMGHFTRSEITSQGVLTPEMKDGNFTTIKSVDQLYIDNEYNTPLHSHTTPIDYNLSKKQAGFAHNPFYGYLPQVIGILIAKLFNLNSIFLLVFARIGNSILYAGLVSLAIKKAPILKIPLFAMACIPLALHQSFSVSIDAMINGLGILIISYFLYLYKKKKIKNKDLITFFILCLLMGLCKLPYLALFLLILLIPRKNFTDKQKAISYLLIISLFILGLLWYKFYAGDKYLDSSRIRYITRVHVNAIEQLYFSLNNKLAFVTMIFNLPNILYDILLGLFTFSHDVHAYSNKFITSLLVLFIGGISLFYPLDEKFSKKVKIGTLFISLIIYVSICLVQFFTWTPVGQTSICGIQPRYFLTLFALAPICFNLNKNKPDIKLDNYVLTFTMFFISTTLLLIAFSFY